MDGNFQQEWQTSNSKSNFPFAQSNEIPQDFIVDLRLFTNGTSQLSAYISSIEYDHNADEYSITFSKPSDNLEILSGSIGRLDNGSSRVGLKSVIAEGPIVCLFTVGSSWDDPSWGGEDSWTRSYSNSDTRISGDLVNPGPNTLRRIFIDGNVPPENEWRRGGSQKLVMGYNCEIGIARGRMPFIRSDVFDINCFGGAGAGYPPDDEAQKYVSSINGVAPSGDGNFLFIGNDCLRVTQPKTDAGIIPNTIQILSDCLPCCPCSEYMKVSRAIGRRSAKVKDECDRLQSILNSSVTAFNDAVATLNEMVRPLVAVRNVRALGSSLEFSVQNISSVSVFAYVAIRVEASNYPLGEIESNFAHVEIVDTSAHGGDVHVAVAAHKSTTDPLPYSQYERPDASIPSTNFSPAEPDVLLCIGQPRSDDGLFPISPGAVVECRIHFPDRALEMEDTEDETGSVAAALPSLSFSSLAVFGSSKSYACSAELYRVQIKRKVAAPDEFDDCERPLYGEFQSVLIE